MGDLAKFGRICVRACVRVVYARNTVPTWHCDKCGEERWEGGVEGWKDRQHGRRARLARKDGKADTLLACLSVSHSRSVWRTRGSGFVPSPAKPGARSKSGLHPGTHPHPSANLGWESTCPGSGSLSVRAPSAAQSWDAPRGGRGGRTEPLALWDLCVPDPGAPAPAQLALTFLRSHGPKSKRSHSGSSLIFPGRGAGRAGRVPGRPEPGLGARGPGWRAVGWLPERREQAARPARTEREERSSALGAGRGRGRKLGRTRAGGGGGAPRRSNPGRAPRAPSRPAGGTEGDFHPDTPRTRPRPRCEAQRAAGPRGRVPEGLRLCTDEEWGRAWGSRLWDPVPEGVHGGAGAQRGSAAPQDQGPSVFRAPSRLQAKVGPGQEQGRGRGEGGRGLGRLRAARR